jgi:hypothetical protein
VLLVADGIGVCFEPDLELERDTTAAARKALKFSELIANFIPALLHSLAKTSTLHQEVCPPQRVVKMNLLIG